MKCCEECFIDIEVKAIIRGLKNLGDCDICKSEDVYIYDTNVNDELIDEFNNLLDVYYPVTNLPKDFPREKYTMLKDALYSDWNIFNIDVVDKAKVYTLIKNICIEKYTENPNLFDSPIGILKLHDEEYLMANSLMKRNQWSDFVNEIKNKNRFHTDYINLNILDDFCNNAKRHYKKGAIFYRGRVSTKKGYPIADMWSPPGNKASAGRVNPLGISYLYLANNIDTTFFEIRAGSYDFVTIGEFELQEDIEVIDFTLLDKISPFSIEGKTQYAINIAHLRNISYEIAKPQRRSDSQLDYLPTQYIVDFIKSKNHQGVKYLSTMDDKGYNLAVFNEDLFECKKVNLYDVKLIGYKHKLVR